MTESACRALLATGWPWPAMLTSLVVAAFAARWLDETILLGMSKLRLFGWLAPSWVRDLVAVVGSAFALVPAAASLDAGDRWVLVLLSAGLGAVASTWLVPALRRRVEREVG